MKTSTTSFKLDLIFEKTNLSSTKSKKQNWKQEQSSCRYHKIIPFYNNKDKPTEVTIRFNNNYETRLPL